MTRVLAALRAARLSILALAVGLLAPALAFAQDVTPPDLGLDPMKVLTAFLAAVQAGSWPVALVLLFVALIWVVRSFGSKWWPWLSTSEGGTVLAFATTLASVLGAAALVPGAVISWALVGKAAAAAFAAIGAWTGARRLLRALLPLAARIPAPVGPILLQLLTWVAGEPAAVQVQKAAEKLYQPSSPTPTAAAAAAELGKPPAP
jgi:hypothetical protein